MIITFNKQKGLSSAIIQDSDLAYVLFNNKINDVNHITENTKFINDKIMRGILIIGQYL